MKVQHCPQIILGLVDDILLPSPAIPHSQTYQRLEPYTQPLCPLDTHVDRHSDLQLPLHLPCRLPLSFEIISRWRYS